MRSFLLVSFLFCYASAGTVEESKKQLEKELQVLQKCMKEGNIPENVVEKMLKGVFPETREGKCFLGCHFKGMGYLSEDGKMDWGKVDEVNKIEYTNPADLAKALEVDEVCRKKVPQNLGNACDAGYSAVKCFIEEAIKRNLTILSPEHV